MQNVKINEGQHDGIRNIEMINRTATEHKSLFESKIKGKQKFTYKKSSNLYIFAFTTERIKQKAKETPRNRKNCNK